MDKTSRKIAIMGLPAVGKSTVTIRYINNTFSESYHPTIENTFQKRIKLNNQLFNTEIIDTAGQDAYSIFGRQYAVGVHGYVLVYSITSLYSFEMVKVINEKILNALGCEQVPRVLVGNKSDMGSDREVTVEQGRALAESWGCQFYETSAKENENIDDIFGGIIEEIQREIVPQRDDRRCVIC
eukprot:TRINITY_DN2495_c0_g1_i1.p1 TRINITY_DN2495_c0_g1~~TRINITY_DN2495_c0_g1_i1.p1  ORF type:complete len:199 (-),score=21.87 TRINITY_DN2495_c0_g1_i1:528-1076(-)